MINRPYHWHNLNKIIKGNTHYETHNNQTQQQTKQKARNATTRHAQYRPSKNRLRSTRWQRLLLTTNNKGNKKMNNKQIKQMLLALQIAFIGALITLPLAMVSLDLKSTLIALLLIPSTAYAYYSLQKELH